MVPEPSAESIPIPQMFWQVLMFLSVSGAFGGIVSSLGSIPVLEFLKSGEAVYGNRRRLAWAVTVGGLYGIGSAVAAGLLLFCDGKLDGDISKDAKTMLFIVSVGVIAGFSGLRLLRLMSGKLEQKVNEIDKKVEEEKKHTDKIQKENERLKSQFEAIQVTQNANQQLSEAISFAGGVLGYADGISNVFNLRRDAVRQLENVLTLFPCMRSIGIFLGRLHRKLGDLPAAIRVLTDMLAARREAKLPQDKDDSALLYNRACYYLERAKKETTDDQRQKMEDLALSDLKVVAKICPTDIREAQTDPDLKDFIKTHADLLPD